jgi:hypothetical protein
LSWNIKTILLKYYLHFLAENADFLHKLYSSVLQQIIFARIKPAGPGVKSARFTSLFEETSTMILCPLAATRIQLSLSLKEGSQVSFMNLMDIFVTSH